MVEWNNNTGVSHRIGKWQIPWEEPEEDESYLSTRGRIFDIQRYSVHDGQGIRTIVFLKGCVLRCRWCCNPESQEFKIQRLRQVDGTYKVVGQDVSVEEVMETVNKDRNYYRRSGGGLTLSGGESLCQPEFARDLLRAAKAEGYTTALESMAGVPYRNIEMVLPYLDQYLMDIKHMDSKKHREFTGKSNELMLENSRKVAKSGQCELIIRTPVIPSFNDTPREIDAIAAHAASLPGVRQMHLLPYHRLGYDKYVGLDRPYEMGDLETPAKEKFMEFQRIVERRGITCIIGG
ncbi:MAG: glycyl-radical enzyme activating protein [Eubacteriales bacterium]|nr:glycyl-radical enzyme activating protein [Eubacteriales bacterium]